MLRQSPDPPKPELHGLVDSTPALPHIEELGAKPPQRPVAPPKPTEPVSPKRHRSARNPSMDYPEDPWNTPDVHRNHNHGPEPPRPNGHQASASAGTANGNVDTTSPQATLPAEPHRHSQPPVRLRQALALVQKPLAHGDSSTATRRPLADSMNNRPTR